LKGGRLKLEFPDILGSRLGLSAERFEMDYNSSGIELQRLTNGAANFFRDIDPGLDSRLGNYTTSMDGPDDQADEVNIFRADWSRDVLGWDVDLFATHATLRSRLNVDFDFLPAALIHVPSRDENPQTTVELRAVSPAIEGLLGLASLFGFSLGSTDFTGGLFYQNRRLLGDRTSIDIDTARLLAAAVASGIDPADDTGGGEPPLGIGAGDVPPLIESSTMFFAQNANSFAAFGNFEWHFLPRWTLVSGLRLGLEDKKAVWKRVFTTPTHVIFTQALNWREFEMRDERSEFDFVPKVALGYKPWDGVSVFASWTKGVKGGGFNDTASGPSGPERTFDRERVEQWEIDSRWRLLDGALAAGLTLFRMDLRDFQLITSRPQDLVQIVENVGLLRAQGVEAEMLFLPAEWLTVFGTVGYNDAHYIEFPFGPCAQSFEDTDGDGDPRCDYAGIPFAPNWNVTFTPAVSFPLETIPGLRSLRWSFGDLALESSLTTVFFDTNRNPLLPVDFRTRNDSFLVVSGRLGVASLGGGWSLALQADNITNTLINVASLEISGLADNFAGVPEPGRVIFGQLRYQF
jgi:outer membrane receptor protein involved in Fe transport